MLSDEMMFHEAFSLILILTM